jgi:hypothetical protein
MLTFLSEREIGFSELGVWPGVLVFLQASETGTLSVVLFNIIGLKLLKCAL